MVKNPALSKRHPEHGYEALHEGGISDCVREACLHHHERVDGLGYPHQMAGTGISLLARMTALCDGNDAIPQVTRTSAGRKVPCYIA